MNSRISIIIPVFDETDTINETIGHLQRLPFETNPEIIVVDGNLSGNTLNAITAGEIKKVLSPKGRGAQMNSGARQASGDILLFLHADTLLPGNAFFKITETMKRKTPSAGAFKLGIRSNRSAFRLIEAGVFLRGLITGIPYGDQAIFIRKSFFEKLGGFKEIPLMEDVDLMRRVKRAGGKIRLIPIRVFTSARRWQKEGIIFCTLRNYFLITLYFLGVAPERLHKFYN